MMKDEHDWEGHPLPANESPDTVIDVWEISPALGLCEDADSIVVRDWHRLLDILQDRIVFLLDDRSRDDLIEGVSLNCKLVQMQKADYDNIVGDADLGGEG